MTTSIVERLREFDDLLAAGLWSGFEQLQQERAKMKARLVAKEAVRLIEELVEGLANARATFREIREWNAEWSENYRFADEEIQHIDALLAKVKP